MAALAICALVLTPASAAATTPPDHTLSEREAIAIASRVPKVREELADHPGFTVQAHVEGPRAWRVSYLDRSREVAQVVVDERRGRAAEAWTGPQVAWQMTRGVEGAFGRKISAPYVWLPLMVLFGLGLVDWRRPLRVEHLDLLVLLAFSVSQYFFNRGEIDVSVPLVYPVLVYLLARMIVLANARRMRESSLPWRPSLPVTYLALLLVFLIGFRIGLNVSDSNVIDVGYSGVIGADRIEQGSSPYGSFPSGNRSGDTYGPVNYYAYVPFEQALPWSGRWDGLPAAHAASIFFDLAVIAGLLMTGRRLRRGREGVALGVSLAFAWTAFPYTVYAMNSNANDSLVAALLVFTFLTASRPLTRGALLALAAATKFAPLALAPLFASYDRRRLRDVLAFVTAFALMLAVVTLPVTPSDGAREIWDRTVGYQLGRGSPFSIWGQHPGLDWLQATAKVLAGGLALLVALWPARKSAVQLAALGAAVMIGLQLTFTHWFYLYIVWWLPFALIALLAREAVSPPPTPSPARSNPPARPSAPEPRSP